MKHPKQLVKIVLLPENVWLWAGLTSYAASTVTAWHQLRYQQSLHNRILIPLLLGVALLALAIASRWNTVGSGPFLTMYEILLSNLFSLGLVYAMVLWLVPLARPGAVIVFPLLMLLGFWITTVPADPVNLPATYDNIWLWVHVGIGKIFLGLCIVSVGLAGILSLHYCLPRSRLFAGLPGTVTLDALAWRFMAVAFVFHGLMLIAGAVWAQDAWGRFWAWDALETWAFITWLTLGISLHARVTYKLPLWAGWLMILTVFILAFLTFFGLPFLSIAPHRGVI